MDSPAFFGLYRCDACKVLCGAYWVTLLLVLPVWTMDTAMVARLKSRRYPRWKSPASCSEIRHYSLSLPNARE